MQCAFEYLKRIADRYDDWVFRIIVNIVVRHPDHNGICKTALFYGMVSVSECSAVETNPQPSPEGRQTDGQSKLNYAVELDTGHISSGSIILCEQGSLSRNSRMRGHLVGYNVGHFIETV